MIDALDTLEKIQEKLRKEDFSCCELKDVKERLQYKHQQYEKLLVAIAEQIDDFDRLYKLIRTGLIPKRIKELQVELPRHSKEMELLRECIKKTYIS